MTGNDKQVASATSCLLGPPNIDAQALRSQFPAFAERPGTLFFDNAATSQKPQSVIDVIDNFYSRECANAGRGSYRMSTSLSSRIEASRSRVARHIAAEVDDVCFTDGATRSLNTVALAWGLANLKSGDEIMLCPEDHKSTVLPWYNLQRLLRSFGIEIRIVPIRIHHEGDYDLDSIREGRTGATRLLAITHVHHVYGLDMEVEEIRRIVGEDVLLCLDASQSVGHRKVDVTQLPVQFLCFSGHKMFAANGVGVLWVAPELRSTMQPISVGGGMMPEGDASELKLRTTSLAARLEAGTQNIPSILSMVPAIDFIESIGLEAVEDQLRHLTKYLYAGLSGLPGIDFAPGVDRCGCHRGTGIISFRFEQAATSDLAFLLDSQNILVRSGDHCLPSRRPGDFYIRVSLHLYNTTEEIDVLVNFLREHLC